MWASTRKGWVGAHPEVGGSHLCGDVLYCLLSDRIIINAVVELTGSYTVWACVRSASNLHDSSSFESKAEAFAAFPPWTD